MTTPTPEAIEAAAIAMFYQQVGLKPPYPLWGDASFTEKDNCRRDAELALSAAYPLMEAEALLGLERVLFDIESQHHIHDVECLCGFKSHRSRSRTEHITGLVRAATIEGKSE